MKTFKYDVCNNICYCDVCNNIYITLKQVSHNSPVSPKCQVRQVRLDSPFHNILYSTYIYITSSIHHVVTNICYYIHRMLCISNVMLLHTSCIGGTYIKHAFLGKEPVYLTLYKIFIEPFYQKKHFHRTVLSKKIIHRTTTSLYLVKCPIPFKYKISNSKKQIFQNQFSKFLKKHKYILHYNNIKKKEQQPCL